VIQPVADGFNSGRRYVHRVAAEVAEEWVRVEGGLRGEGGGCEWRVEGENRGWRERVEGEWRVRVQGALNSHL
jgi:hypothetical protein